MRVVNDDAPQAVLLPTSRNQPATGAPGRRKCNLLLYLQGIRYGKPLSERGTRLSSERTLKKLRRTKRHRLLARALLYIHPGCGTVCRHATAQKGVPGQQSGLTVMFRCVRTPAERASQVHRVQLAVFQPSPRRRKLPEECGVPDAHHHPGRSGLQESPELRHTLLHHPGEQLSLRWHAVMGTSNPWHSWAKPCSERPRTCSAISQRSALKDLRTWQMAMGSDLLNCSALLQLAAGQCHQRSATSPMNGAICSTKQETRMSASNRDPWWGR